MPQTATGSVAPSRPALSARSRSKALFFLAAGLSFVASVSLWFTGHREEGLFVGLWVPSICSAGALLLAGGADHE
jgi:hypothetical protein